MPAAAMTYTTLLTDVLGYAERQDLAFSTQIPRFIMLAENRISDEARGLGFLKSVQGDLTAANVNGQQLAKPNLWRETASITIGTGDDFNERVSLKGRSYEYCRMYAPNATVYAQPKFYADWEWGQYLLAPTPDLAYPYEWIYYQRPDPLSAEVSTNWTTKFAPQLILFATLLEAQHWIKRQDRVAEFQTEYDRALKQVEFVGKRQIVDRTAARENPGG